MLPKILKDYCLFFLKMYLYKYPEFVKNKEEARKGINDRTRRLGQGAAGKQDYVK